MEFSHQVNCNRFIEIFTFLFSYDKNLITPAKNNMVEAIRSSKQGKLVTMVHNITNGVVNTFRGYSPEDVNTAKRITSGDITQADRQKYIENETLRLSLLGSFGHNITPGLNNLPGPFLGINPFLDEIRRIVTIPPEQLDQDIITQARQHLAEWGQP